MASLQASLVTLAVLAVPATAQVRVIAGGPDVTGTEVQAVASMARQGLSRLSPFFPGTPTREIRVVLHADADGLRPDLRRSLHPGVPGFALLQRDEIHLVMAAIQVDPPNDLKTTVDHELVHILLDQYVGRHGRYVARWFHEGLAQDLAGGGYLGVQEEDLVYRVHARTYIPFRDLEEGFPRGDPKRLALAYGQSYSFVSFLRRTLGLETLLAAAKNCNRETTFRVALARIVRKGLVVYEDMWLDYILHESGAGFRVILRNCFFIILLIAAGPLLALAVARRRNREEWIKQRLGEEDRAEDEAAAAAQRFYDEYFAHDRYEDEFDDDDEVDWDDWQTDPNDPDYEGPRRDRDDPDT